MSSKEAPPALRAPSLAPELAPSRRPPGGRLTADFAAGARLLTLRGLFIRVVGAFAALALLALVTPTELGILAIVRSASGLVEQCIELGLLWPFLRSRDEPSRADYASLAGTQLAIVLAILALAMLVPGAPRLFGLLEPSTEPWLLALLGAMVAIPFGTGARVRLERRLRYGVVSLIESSAVLLHGALVLGFTLAGRFVEGVFAAQIAYYLWLHGWYVAVSPGPWPSLRPHGMAGRIRASGGFTLAYLAGVAKDQGTPLLVAALFGVRVAGIWAFSTRLGHLVQFAYEGVARVAVPAATRVAADPAALRQLATDGLCRASSLAVPGAAALAVSLPVVAWLWPQWSDAVPLAQVFVPASAIAGAAAAALAPIAVARAGWRPLLLEQAGPLLVLIAGLVALRVLARDDYAVVAVAAHASAFAILFMVTDREVLPAWQGDFTRGLAALATGALLYAIGRALHWHVVVTAVVASAGVLAWVHASILTFLLGRTGASRT